MTPNRFRCWTVLLCSLLRECCWCVLCTTFICLCGRAEEDIFSSSDFSATLIFLACFSSLKLLHQLFLRAFSAYLHPISLRNLSLPQFSHPSICLLTILSISNPFCLSPPPPPPPPPLLPQHHLRSISVFSPSSMCLQPFSHPTSNQTYSAY